jgi:hypothetical protein
VGHRDTPTTTTPIEVAGVAVEFVEAIPGGEIDPKYCHAISRRSGTQCRRFPIKGAKVCRFHGGNAPQVRAGAARRIAIQNATLLVARLGGTINIDPLDALLEMVQEAAANVAAYRLAIQELGIHVGQDENREGQTGVAVASSYDDKGGRDPAAPHILVNMYDAERDRLAKYSKMCIDAGVEERRVRLVEAQAQKLGAVVEAAVRALNPTPDDYRRAVQAAAQAMRQLAAGDTTE